MLSPVSPKLIGSSPSTTEPPEANKSLLAPATMSVADSSNEPCVVPMSLRPAGMAMSASTNGGAVSRTVSVPWTQSPTSSVPSTAVVPSPVAVGRAR